MLLFFSQPMSRSHDIWNVEEWRRDAVYGLNGGSDQWRLVTFFFRGGGGGDVTTLLLNC